MIDRESSFCTEAQERGLPLALASYHSVSDKLTEYSLRLSASKSVLASFKSPQWV